MKIHNNILFVEKPIITSPYGWRYLKGEKQFHNGTDIVSQTNNRDVIFPLDGIVVYDFDDYIHNKRFEDSKHSGGNYCIIKCKFQKDIYYIKLLHLVANFVELQQEVKAGDLIGRYGDVGYSFGAHLHISIYNEKWQLINSTAFINRLDDTIFKEKIMGGWNEKWRKWCFH